jgi:hypothetical protein
VIDRRVGDGQTRRCCSPRPARTSPRGSSTIGTTTCWGCGGHRAGGGSSTSGCPVPMEMNGIAVGAGRRRLHGVGVLAGALTCVAIWWTVLDVPRAPGDRPRRRRGGFGAKIPTYPGYVVGGERCVAAAPPVCWSNRGASRW